MSAGVPVLTSAGGALEEIAGDAALLIDPLSIDAIAAALDQALSSPELRERLRAAGQARERQYSWQQTARRTLDVWRRAAGRAA